MASVVDLINAAKKSARKDDQVIHETSAVSDRLKSARESAQQEDRTRKPQTVLPTASQNRNNAGIELPGGSEQDGALSGLTLLPSSPQQAARDFAYASERIGAGLLGAVEGVTDIMNVGIGKAVQGVTSLGGLAPNPVSEWGRNWADTALNTSPTQDWEESIRRRYNPTRGMETVTGVEQAIAQMLPGIGAARAVSAVGQVGNALNAAQAAGRGANAGQALFGLQAAGQSAQQAKQEGATTNEALAYGAASGLLESAIEGIAGGIPALGKGRLNDVVSAVTKNPVLNRAADIAGEGAEEALSTAVTPYLQRAVYNPAAENATPQEILQSAALGSLAAGVLQGGLELPGAVSRTVSDIRDVRQAVGSNQDIINRANQRISQDMQARREAVNPLLTMLPTAEEVQNRQAGQRAMRAEMPGGEQQNIASTGEEVLDMKIEPSARTSAPETPAVQPVNAVDSSTSTVSILPGGQEVNVQAGSTVQASVEQPRAVPSEDIAYDVYGSGRENLPETAVGANKASPWTEFVASSKEFFPEGANAARDVDVPTTDPQGRRIRKTAATAMGAKAIPDEAIADIQNMVLRGELSYNRVSDKSSIDRATKTIQDKGYQGALEEFRNSVSKGVVSKDIATLGQQLLINAANAGDGKTTAELLTLYAQMETTAGQAVQAASILRKLSPSDQLYAAQKAANELDSIVKKKKPKSKTKPQKDAAKIGEEIDKSVKEQKETAYRLIRNIHEASSTSKDHGVPAENWMKTVGEYLAKEIRNNLNASSNGGGRSQVPITRTIQNDLYEFAKSYLPEIKKKTTSGRRTAADRIRDYFNNRENYARAWNESVSAFREQNKVSPDNPQNEALLNRAEDWLYGTISYSGSGTDAVMMRAVVDAAINEDNTLKSIARRSRLGDNEALENEIFERLNSEVRATGSDAETLRLAVRRYLNDTVSDFDIDIDREIDTAIRRNMRKAGIRMSEIIKENSESKQEAARSIADMLVSEFGISSQVADRVSEIVTNRFDEMVKEAARKKMDSLLQKRTSLTRSQIDKFVEFVNLGAFQSDRAPDVAEKLFGSRVTIDPELIFEFERQTDQAGRDRVMEKIYQNIADQVPNTWRDKWNAWRYLAMLGNPRTHIRNIAGNFFFQPLRIVKDRTAAAIEAGVSLASGGRLQRTKSFAANPVLYKAAWNDWGNVRNVLSGNGNKYDDIRSEINSRRRIFRAKPLELARTGNSWLLEFEDTIFKRITYADALAGYLQANGVTAEQMRTNTVDAGLMARARDYAGQEALRATYQDRNKVSDKVVQVANVLGPAGEAILPFKRTPANILVRGLEYSPAGLAKALTADLIQVKRGNMTGADAIDHIASGLTGSALFALGAYLFSQGIVTSGGGDDENQDRLNELTGGQNYALNLPGGGNVTLDWLAPEALPFFMGVELMDSMGQSGNTTDSIMTALKSVSDPMLELSMLQSLNDVIDSVSFSENKLGALASSAVVSYFTQAIPTLGGQFERTGEENRMSTYTDKALTIDLPGGLPEVGVPTDVQYAIGRASARIPGWDYQQIPYIDAWGREESNGPLVLRAGNNFLNPAYTSSLNVTPVDEEIQRLYTQTGDGGVVPDRPNRYITVNGERVDLSAEQYVQYATERGQMQFDMLNKLIDRSAYQRLTDSEKAAVISDVYQYADAVTKAEISDYQPDSWISKVQSSGVDPANYILYRTSLEDGMTLQDKDKAMTAAGITGNGKARLLIAENPDWADDAKEAGVTQNVFVEYKILTSGLTGDKDAEGNTISGSKKAKVLAAINSMDIDSETKDALYYAAGYAASGIRDTPWH